MKKYKMLNNKKIILYLYLLIMVVIAFIANIYLFYIDMPFNIGSYIFINLVFAIIPLLIINNNYISFFVINDEMILKGLFLKRKIKWKDIEKVEMLNASIKIYSSEKIVIEILKRNLLEKDYLILKKDILDRAKNNNSLVDNSKELSNLYSKRIGGWLIPFILLIFISSYNSLVNILKGASDIFYVSSEISFWTTGNTILHIIMFIYSIYIIIHFYRKKKEFTAKIAIYRWFAVFYVLIDNLIKFIEKNYSHDIGMITNSILQVLLALITTLIIIEYFKISERAKVTFL